LLVQNSDGTDLFTLRDNNTWNLNSISVDSNSYIYTKTNRLAFRNGSGAYLGRFDSNGFQIGNGSSAATARLQVKGSGTTSATTALLVENSAGTDLLKVDDAGIATFSGNTIANRLYTSLGFYHTGNSNNVLTPNSTTGWVFQTANVTGNIQVKNANVTASKETTAALQVDSTTQGFLPPRMTDAEKNAINAPAPGLMVYDTSANQMSYFNGSGWINF
jgi:hypothetical protein